MKINDLYSIFRCCYSEKLNERKLIALVPTRIDAEYIVGAMEIFESFDINYEFEIVRNYSEKEVPRNADDISTREMLDEFVNRQRFYCNTKKSETN